MSSYRIIVTALPMLVLLAGSAGASSLAAEVPDFRRDILPILSEHCFPCHGPDAKTREADLRLDTREGMLGGAGGTPVVIPGRSAESELFRRLVSSDPDELMPPPDTQRPLNSQQIERLRLWIDGGAIWARHWSFVPVKRPTFSQHGSADASGANPIDTWIRWRLEREHLAPAPPADRATLLRRVTLDLTGLPPTPDEVDAFLADAQAGAYERVVDRLLASPSYGERMVWDWLDAARYADSNGYQGDGERTMYPWRDWAVEAFNRDLPFDQFTIWQLAGDLLPAATREQRLATGFCRNHMINGEGGRIAEENRVDYVMDMAETVGTVWLGLTLNCARCHDHKYDPLRQRDYYGLFAFFNQTPVDGGGGNPQTAPTLEMPTEAEVRQREELRQRVVQAARELGDFEKQFFPRNGDASAAESDSAKDLPDDLKKALSKAPADRGLDQLRQLEDHWKGKSDDYVAKLRQLGDATRSRDELQRRIARVMVMEDRAQPRETFVLTKGLYNKPAELVTAATPESLPPLPAGAVPNRRALAEWLVSPDHPLTARVIVNRFWQQIFGVGLVKTSEDFGVQGEPPVHPELLDWLAAEFVARDWSVKQLVRLIVTSAAYQQTSAVSAAAAERDPENRLLARGPRFRMPAWMIRDQALAASGLLVAVQGGPPLRPYQPEGVWEEATFGNKRYQQDHGAALYRRTVYTFWRRIVAPTMLFDVAPRQTCVVKQARTNTPLQALVTLNDVTYVEAARALAERVLTAGSDAASDRVDRAFRQVLARRPTEAERQILLDCHARLTRQYGEDLPSAREFLAHGESPPHGGLDPVEHAAWTAVCLAILNLDEALTKE